MRLRTIELVSTQDALLAFDVGYGKIRLPGRSRGLSMGIGRVFEVTAVFIPIAAIVVGACGAAAKDQFENRL